MNSILKISKIIILLLMPCFLQAQFFDRVGLSLGGSFASQTITRDYFSQNPMDCLRPGIDAYVHISGPINHFLAFSSDLGYVQKGYKVSKQLKEWELTIHYISYSPHFKIGKFTDTYEISLIAGPRVDYQVGYNREPGILTEKHLNTTVIGGDTGFDITIIPGRIGFNAFFLYQFDFTNLKYYVPGPQRVYRNMAILINFGIIYLLDKNPLPKA